jgi:hypothetical protein
MEYSHFVEAGDFTGHLLEDTELCNNLNGGDIIATKFIGFLQYSLSLQGRKTPSFRN